jgi:hypothetical protein
MVTETERPRCVNCGAPATIRRNGTASRACESALCRTRVRTRARQAVMRDLRASVLGDAGDPWAISSPSYDARLPERCHRIEIEGAPAWLCTLDAANAMHAVLELISREPGHRHHRALWPDAAARCWWATVPASDGRRALGGYRYPHAVAGQRRVVSLGPAITLRTPPPLAAGRYRVRVEALTPVVIRANAGRYTRTEPDAGNIASALGYTLAPRLGLPAVPPEMIACDLATRATAPAALRVDRRGRIGGDGVVRGWVGAIEVECSALAAWLLACAAALGLGGRTAYGFGRVRVGEVTR